MKSQHPILKMFSADLKIILILALPIFIAAMWFGISHHFDDIALYAVAMAIASWVVAGQAIHVVRKWQEWRMQSRRGPDA